MILTTYKIFKETQDNEKLDSQQTIVDMLTLPGLQTPVKSQKEIDQIPLELGLLVTNSDIKKLCFCDGTKWIALT